EGLRIGPDDLAGPCIPGDEVAEVVFTLRRVHRQCRSDVGLAGGVRHLEGLVIHADVVGRHVEQPGLWREGSRLLVLRTKGRRTDLLVIDVLAFGARGGRSAYRPWSPN